MSIIAGVAAQSTLGNVIAGVQLAFSGAIRVDDVVVADGQWGRIEEITLTYVVVHVWDDRRLVLPSTWFTTTPFENWTRTSSQLMQAVEFDLDFRVDPQAMREALHEILGRTNLWDGRTAVLQVTDAIGGYVHVRILLDRRRRRDPVRPPLLRAGGDDPLAAAHVAGGAAADAARADARSGRRRPRTPARRGSGGTASCSAARPRRTGGPKNFTGPVPTTVRE